MKNCKYGCQQKYVSYECQFKENGKCGYYYEIENTKEILDFYNGNLEDLYDRFYEAEYKYERERESAKKEK